jgi:hypothetical protein
MGSLDFPTYKKKTGLKTIFFLVSFIFAIFFVNYPFQFIKIPESILKFENWIIFAGGIFILFGAVNYLRASKKIF